MKPISNARIVIILLVALFSIYKTYPTVRYYVHLTHEPAMNGTRPFADTNRPPDSQTEELLAWQKKNPEVVAWRKANPEYLKWEAEADRLRADAIPLGLDLRGGVDVTLDLDQDKMIANQVQALKDRIRNDTDLANQKISVQFVDNADPTKLTLKVADPADAQTVAATINKKYGSTIEGTISAAALADGPVTFGLDPAVLDTEMKGDLEGAMKAIQDRVDSLGVTQPKITLQGTERIRVQVPGEKDPDRLIRNVIRPADLEFHMVYPDEEKYLGADGKVQPDAVLPPGYEAVPGKLGKVDKKTGQIEYTSRDYIVLKAPELTGADLRSAGVTYNPTDLSGPIQVSLEFKPEGAAKFADLTRKASGKVPKEQMAILLDGVVRSAPTLDEPILDGRAVIRGGFSQEEANELSQVLKAGSLPAPLKVASKRTIGATLGNQSILSGVRALGWGAVLIAAFMILYYGTAGVIAVIALILNTLIIVAIMALSRATLTLSGIGGILLTMGMAVDANVLIYEHIREELSHGRALRQAIGTGFNRAFTVILDSNMTTLMTAMVLLQFTEGSVFGFALTMTFGLIANLFTGLTVTYTLCALWFGWKGNLSLGKLAMFKNTAIDFIKLRFVSLSGSAIVFLVALVLVLNQGGLKMGVDFAGGLTADVEFTQQVDEPALRALLKENGIEGASVTRVVDQKNSFLLDLPLLVPKASDGSTSGTVAVKAASGTGDPTFTENQLRAALGTQFVDVKNNLEADQSKPGYILSGVTSFDPQMGQEFSHLAIVVILLASIAIMFYLWFRFEPVFGVAAVVALLHDLFIVTLICSLWHVEISLDEVAALMVLLGFSVNDTIVIFDRIRENAGTVFGKSFKEQCNLAMNQSLSRTVITSGTVLLASLMLLIFGGPGLGAFAKIITVGSICGTYSSDFIATPLVYMWNQYQGNRVQQQLADKRRKKVDVNEPVRSPGRRGTAPSSGK